MTSAIYNWQHLPEHIDPTACSIGPIQVSWYGLMYLAAFALVYFLVRRRIKTEKTNISLEAVQKFFPWLIIGLLLGARLGDVFIYDWAYFQNHLSQIFLPFDISDHWRYTGIYGMSYFGGLIGIVLAFFIFLRLNLKKERFSLKKILELSDIFAPAVPLAYAFGRLGNFLNGELFGRVTTKFWGMYFPADITGQLRHPSQLYELFLEGILLFVILWNLRKYNFPVGYLTSFYLVGYGFARFTSEFFREPDNNWFFFSLTIGQWFSIVIIIFGLAIIFFQKKKVAG
ncbi:MAG TPA: prolipoprotein diacylglyceryl transferase [Candidatus Bathyarchaeia archaeon]|nr:prolipoprotein diacylglyceryl transferase [Candidatus Bathyarchaeia archaeon]